VLDFAKVEGGKDAYEFIDTDLADVVVRAVDLLHYRAEREGVALVVDVEPAPLVLDARAIELALINVIDNALKYAKSSDAIVVKVTAQPDGATISVEDEGPGIPPEEQGRIFDRFVRGKNAQSMHTRGSGIGLALVKHIAESHGGSVAVHSPAIDKASGTSFVIHLPAHPPDWGRPREPRQV
jgi:two-component system phosphate regulon sensor histidine kinase PhoR